MLNEQEAIARVNLLGRELDRRGLRHREVEAYYTGNCPVPAAVTQSKLTKAYKALMGISQTNYARMIIKAAASRLEVGGIKSGDTAADTAAWALWQENRLDGDAKLAISEALKHGRCFGVAWPDETGVPVMTFDDAATAIVEYQEGSRHRRASALRRWQDDDGRVHATLYTPDALYKLSRPEGSLESNVWERREVEGEQWPLPNPFGFVPVTEIATNRSLALGRFGRAQGDIDHALTLMDRINTIEFVRLVIAFTSGFPVRVVIGNKIVRDDEGNAIAPFDVAANVLGQLENPAAKVEELSANDPKAIGEALALDIEALAGITQTPAYYMRSIPIQNVSADAIRASDAPLNARVEDHKPQLGEGFEEFMRTAALMSDISLPNSAEVQWVNRESRSLAERADAAVKLATVMPWQALVEYVFDASQDQIDRWQMAKTFDQMTALDFNAPTGPTAR